MASPPARVVLVSRKERPWIASCEKALTERGIDSVEAHNCWSADIARKLSGGEAVVIDGEVMCDFVSAERPGPVLVFGPELPVVIFNAQSLDEQQRSAALAHEASMVDGDDPEEVARHAQGALTPA